MGLNTIKKKLPEYCERNKKQKKRRAKKKQIRPFRDQLKRKKHTHQSGTVRKHQSQRMVEKKKKNREHYKQETLFLLISY